MPALSRSAILHISRESKILNVNVYPIISLALALVFLVSCEKPASDSSPSAQTLKRNTEMKSVSDAKTRIALDDTKKKQYEAADDAGRRKMILEHFTGLELKYIQSVGGLSEEPIAKTP